MTEKDVGEALIRIDARLERIEERLGDHVRDEGEWQKATDHQLRAIDRTLRGNGNTPGHGVRLDRIEQREAGRARLLWIAVTAAAGALAAWVRNALR